MSIYFRFPIGGGGTSSSSQYLITKGPALSLFQLLGANRDWCLAALAVLPVQSFE